MTVTATFLALQGQQQSRQKDSPKTTCLEKAALLEDAASIIRDYPKLEWPHRAPQSNTLVCVETPTLRPAPAMHGKGLAPPGGTNSSVGGTNSGTNGIKRKGPPH